MLNIGIINFEPGSSNKPLRNNKTKENRLGPDL
jgi:hypothetical protein